MHPDTHIIAIMNNGAYEIAPEITDKKEYDPFFDSYMSGLWLKMSLYQIDEQTLAGCPDESRNYDL